MGWKGLANGFRCTEEEWRGSGRDVAEGGDFSHKPRELTSLLITRSLSSPVKLVRGEKYNVEAAPSLCSFEVVQGVLFSCSSVLQCFFTKRKN